jgi:CheY-like chemotaxis protein
MPGETVLIVEDNAIVAFALQRTLTRLGYNVFDPVDSGEEAVTLAAARMPDLVLMDLGLAGSLDGITAAEKIQALAPVPVIYLTGNNHDPRLQKTFCLSKPVVEKELAQLMDQALRQARGPVLPALKP